MMKKHTSQLAFDLYKKGEASNVAVFLHGILGTKRNWRTPANAFIKRHPSFMCVAVDNRAHGDSLLNDGAPSTVSQCAIDLQNLLTQEIKCTPSMIIAHSFGGKVALNYLEQMTQEKKKCPEHIWILDSLPGPYDKENDVANKGQSVQNVFDCLFSLPSRFESKDEMIERLIQRGLDKPIALWLAMNIYPLPLELQKHPNDKYYWKFNIHAISELFDDFCRMDKWKFLETYEGGTNIHFVRAGKNVAWTPEILSKFNDITSKNARIRLHTMPHVGHWLHAEDLHGLLDIISNASDLR